jgi:glycosyltransferase involved in cell wall biosynthesis
VLTQNFGFPEGNAASIRARLVTRALVEAGAFVRVFCTRYGDIPPDIENTRVRGTYEGVEFRYTNGRTTRSSSFISRRVVEVRGLASALAGIASMRRAGELDAVYLWSPHRWHPLRQIYVSFLNALGIPIVLEVNELPWSQRSGRWHLERILSPLHGVTGAIAISEYLETWVDSEARRLGREVPVLRLPILVDTDEVSVTSPVALRANPFVLFACPAGRTRLFRLVAEAMRQVWDEGLSCDLVIVGPSFHDQQNRWLAEIEGQSIHGSITWLGRLSRPELLGLYRKARGLLVPLEVELNSEARFPTKLGEYLASGTPVVATSLGELPRLLTDGENAYLAPPGSARVFGQRIADLLRDPVAAGQVGIRGRGLAISELDYRRHAERLRDWFEALTEERREP